MIKLFVIISCCLFFLGCQEQGKKNSISSETDKQGTYIPIDSTEFYFPTEGKDKSGIDSFCNTWYSSHLFAMKEPILFKEKSQAEIYRFTWLRTFHNPIVIRIEKLANSYMLYWKLSNGLGGYEPGVLTINKEKIIDKKIWVIFNRKVIESNFWNLETEKEALGTDGSQWILEGKNSKQYHVVDRWTPTEGKYYECCDFLIGLTDLNIKGDDKY